MAISKVVYGAKVLVDLTSDTVDAAHLAKGYTAHDAGGEAVSGTAPIWGGVGVHDAMQAKAAAYVSAAESAYSDSDYATASVVGDYASESEHLDAEDPAYDAEPPLDGTGYMVDMAEPRLSWSKALSAGQEAKLYGLVPGHTSLVELWSDTLDQLVDVTGYSVTDHGMRLLGGPDGGKNVRDLGGFACDGGTVRYGVLYRGADIGGYAGYCADLATTLHVRDEVDIQGAESTATKSFFPGATYHHFPLDTPSSYEELYKLDGTQWGTTKACVEHVMQNAVSGVVTYLHCSLGADRTGAVCCWLQGILGVSGKHLDISYEATALAGKIFGTTSALKYKRTYAPWVGLRNYFASLGSSMLEGCLHWAYMAGIDIALINAYRAAMSTGTPETLSYKRWNVSYTNQIPISTDTDGSVFNGTGYKSGYYLTSSGALDSWSGVEVTGFIPCKYGDVVRLSGITMTSTNANAGTINRVLCYQSDKSTVTAVCNSRTNSIKWWDATYDSDNNVVQFTCYAKDTAYIRICAEEINGESVITVNEEIK